MRRRRKTNGSARALPRLRALVGANIQLYRADLGWSQERLGEQSGLSGKFIGEVERRVKSISVDSLGRLARALRVALPDLVRR